MNSWLRRLPSPLSRRFTTAAPVPPPLPYSWVLTGQLAIGPMPSTPEHWQQLQDLGINSRFSCCYPEEEAQITPPTDWHSSGMPLPDHRQQEKLTEQRLSTCLDRVEATLDNHAPLYLHCLAGKERSPLLAVGLVARRRRLNLFDALDWVRRCHPMANPIYGQLEMLEQVLNRSNS